MAAIATALILVGWSVALTPAQSASSPRERQKSNRVPGQALFSDGRVRTFKIQVDEPGLSVLQKNERSYVRCTVTEGTNVYPQVGLHLKGMGSFRPFNEKPSVALKFDRFVDRQDYDGLTKVMLNNASQDPTYLAEWVATQMFRDAGVPAARVTHAFLEINGRPLGLYVLIEAMNKDFLRQHFSSARGNLYEAYLQDIDQQLDLDGGTETDQADLHRLLEVCKIQNRAERWLRLPEVLDVDRYLSHLAVEMFTSHTDGYAMNRNNYRLYHDPATGRFVFLAHGIDWAFANGGVSIRPPLNSLVTRAVLEPPEGRKAYRARLGHLFTNHFRLENWTNRVQSAVAALKAAARNPNEAKEFEGFGREMCGRLVTRWENIAGQLAAPEPVPVKFGTNGQFLLTSWIARSEQGEVRTNRVQLDERSTLHIAVAKGDVVASWRTKVLLDEGRYRLEGRARTAQIVSLTNKVERGNGAGLRVSGDKRTGKLEGDTGWTLLQHEFEVLPGGDEKEMVCELRARQGEVWFDADSLRLVRMSAAP